MPQVARQGQELEECRKVITAALKPDVPLAPPTPQLHTAARASRNSKLGKKKPSPLSERAAELVRKHDEYRDALASTKFMLEVTSHQLRTLDAAAATERASIVQSALAAMQHMHTHLAAFSNPEPPAVKALGAVVISSSVPSSPRRPPLAVKGRSAKEAAGALPTRLPQHTLVPIQPVAAEPAAATPAAAQPASAEASSEAAPYEPAVLSGADAAAVSEAQAAEQEAQHQVQQAMQEADALAQSMLLPYRDDEWERAYGGALEHRYYGEPRGYFDLSKKHATMPRSPRTAPRHSSDARQWGSRQAADFYHHPSVKRASWHEFRPAEERASRAVTEMAIGGSLSARAPVRIHPAERFTDRHLALFRPTPPSPTPPEMVSRRAKLPRAAAEGHGEAAMASTAPTLPPLVAFEVA